MEKERDEMEKELDKMKKECDEMKKERDDMKKERDDWQKKAEAYKKCLPEANTEKPIGASLKHSESSPKRMQAFDEECEKKKAKNHAMMKESLTYPRVSVLGHPCNLTAASPVEMAEFAIEANIIKAGTLKRQHKKTRIKRGC